MPSLANDNFINNHTTYSITTSFINQANINQVKFDELNQKAHNNYEEFWGELAHTKISWHKPFTTTLNNTKAPFYKWFEDGVLNVSYNCLDRHLRSKAHKTAIIFEADDGAITKITYQELHTKVCQFANGLKSIGVKSGDRVIVYMNNSIEAIIAMQSIARIGAIHSVVFGGFSSIALADRIIDAKAEYIITVNGYHRGGKLIELKKMVDEALINIDKNIHQIKHTIIHNRTPDLNTKITPHQDIWWNDVVDNQDKECIPEWVTSEHPLFILYTSGSTGKPKGILHTSGGYLLGTIVTMEWVFDYKDTDCYWCTADVGWITGHSYICYGPLAVGATQVIFEGIPTYPSADRFWQMIERHKVTTFYTAPTAIRNLIKLGATLPKNHNLSSLRLLGSVGEPINPEAWKWYYEVVGNSKCPIVDTWWQTETGCNMLSPIPGVQALKPGSCVSPIPGIMAVIIDENGNSIKPGESGYLVITKPFPSQLRTIWNADDKFIKTYYPQDIADGRYYIAGDSAQLDTDGYFWILGRIDDVLNVSGHRLGTMEIESAITMHPSIAEAAVVGKPHAIKGEGIFAFVVCKKDSSIKDLSQDDKTTLTNQINAIISKEIGAIAKIDEIKFVEGLPKTRSGKIMRRLLRNIVRGEEITQDISTLENPAIINTLKL